VTVYIYGRRRRWVQRKEIYMCSTFPQKTTSEKRVFVPTFLYPSAFTKGVDIVTRRVRLLRRTLSLRIVFVDVCSACV
jgi:hypothetical protein